jgi:diguanylate cyclase (GGDEF)-like protein
MSPLSDQLTGLMNRAALHESMEDQLKRAAEDRSPLGLILFDIDRFKLINYGLGDMHGDIVLQKVASAARNKLRHSDQVGRWSGQQFLCILPHADYAATAQLAEELRSLIQTLIVPIDSHRIHVTASFGVACFPHDGDLPRRLLAASEAALYHAKDSGRNRVVQARSLQQQVFGMGTLLDAALQENRVVPAYQPIVELKTGHVVAEEALARLITPEGEVIAAEDFIEVARQLQLTYKIDRAMMMSAVARCAATPATERPRIHFMNISGNLLRHPDVVKELLAMVQDYCRRCGRDPNALKPLVIEVTERELLGDIKTAREMLAPFVDFGLHLALDDFGSGYSSFQYLADLPFSFLKIEGSLIQRIAEPKVRAIVRGIQNTAADLGLTTLAECVENEQVADIVQEIGIDWAQGFYYDRPTVP